MDTNALVSWLTEGLTTDEAAVVRKAVERDSVKNNVATLKQKQEYDALATQAENFRAELEGSQGKPGAKVYQQWYANNYATIQSYEQKLEAYQQKYGSLEAPTQTTAQPTAQPQFVINGKQVTPDEYIAHQVDQRIRGGYAPRWSDLLTDTGSIVQKHMLAGRKNPIDFKALAKVAEEKFNGNLELAYDEYDKPEREKEATTRTEAEIERRVKERVQQQGFRNNFPAGADSTPGSLSAKPKDVVEKFNRNQLLQDLHNTFVGGEVN